MGRIFLQGKEYYTCARGSVKHNVGWCPTVSDSSYGVDRDAKLFVSDPKETKSVHFKT